MKCFIFSRRSTSWICFNNDMNIAIQCLKEWQNHDSAFNEFKNCENWHHSNSETVLSQKYDCHTLLTKLWLLISLFRKEACQCMFLNQQENLILLLKCRIHCKKSDYAHLSAKKLKIQHNKHLFFIIKKL